MLPRRASPSCSWRENRPLLNFQTRSNPLTSSILQSKCVLQNFFPTLDSFCPTSTATLKPKNSKTMNLFMSLRLDSPRVRQRGNYNETAGQSATVENVPLSPGERDGVRVSVNLISSVAREQAHRNKNVSINLGPRFLLPLRHRSGERAGERWLLASQGHHARATAGGKFPAGPFPRLPRPKIRPNQTRSK